MNKKQFLAGGLAAAMCAVSMAGCGGGKIANGGTSGGGTAPAASASSGSSYVDAAKKNTNFNAKGDKIVNAKQKFTIWVGQMSNQKKANMKECVKKAEEATNVQIDWVEVPTSGWKEKTNVVLASGNLPDAFCGEIDISNYMDRFVPLNELLEAYAPTTEALFKIRPDYPASLSDGQGKIRGLPIGDEYIGNSMNQDMWMNQQWLDRVGKKMPTTTDEFEDVLKAFKEKDANGNGDSNDEIPFAFRGLTDWSSGCCQLFGAFGVPESDQHVLRDEKTNKISLCAQQEGYYKALTWLHKLYSEGLISSTAFTESGDSYNTKNAGKDVVGAYYGYGDSALSNDKLATTWYKENLSHIFGHVAPLKGPDGNNMVFQSNLAKRPGFLITTACKNPEVLVRWYDYVNTGLDNYAEWRYGQEGKRWNEKTVTEADVKNNNQLKVGEKVPALKYIKDWKSLGYSDSGAYEGAESFAGWSPAIKYDEKHAQIIDENTEPVIKTLASNDNLKNGTVVHGVPNGMSSKENSEQRANLLADLDTYIKRFVSDSVVNGIDDNKWKTHLEKLKQLNVDKYVQLCQEATDNIVGRTKDIAVSRVDTTKAR